MSDVNSDTLSLLSSTSSSFPTEEDLTILDDLINQTDQTTRYSFNFSTGDFSYGATNSDSSDGKQVGKVKRKRKPVSPFCKNGQRASMYINKPRIFKNDIRRQYMDMYANVYNAWNKDFLTSYITSMFRPSATYTSTEVDFRSGKLTTVRALTSAGAYLETLCEQFTMHPDAVFKLTAVQLLVRSDQTAVVMGDFIMSGTRIVKLTNAEDMEQKTSKQASKDSGGNNIDYIQSCESNSISGDSADEEVQSQTSTPEENIASQATGYLKTIQEASSPNTILKPFLIDGTLKLHIDNEKKIFHVEFFYNWNKPIQSLNNDIRNSSSSDELL